MDIEKTKYQLSNVHSQLILFDQNGSVKFSCDTLFPIQKQDNLAEQFDFFDHIWNKDVKLKKEKNIRIPCMNIQYDNHDYFLDITIKALGNLCILFLEDQTKLYCHVQKLQQDRNIISIQEEQLEILKKEQDLFFSKVNHEIRTPLNSIIGLSHLIKGSDSEKELLVQYTEALVNSAEHLRNIVNDILDLSKFDSLTMQLHPSSHSILSILQEVKSTFEYQLKIKNLSLLFDTSNQELFTTIYLIDAVRLKQIFINLINNAINFSTEGSIQIHAQFLKKKGNIHTLAFSIKDEGIGIPEDKVSSLFKEFVQVPQTSPLSERSSRGTGLGLSIVKQLVELHQGSIRAESTTGTGTTIHFDIQLERTTSSNSQINKEKLLEEGIQCLIVEDDEMNKLILEKLLQRLHCKTISCTSAEEALEILSKDNQLDIVLTDFHMDNVTGLELRNLHQFLHPNSKLKWVLVSGSGFIEDENQEILEAFNDHILKPVCPDSLYSILLNLFQKKSTP